MFARVYIAPQSNLARIPLGFGRRHLAHRNRYFGIRTNLPLDSLCIDLKSGRGHSYLLGSPSFFFTTSHPLQNFLSCLCIGSWAVLTTSVSCTCPSLSQHKPSGAQHFSFGPEVATEMLE